VTVHSQPGICKAHIISGRSDDIVIHRKRREPGHNLNLLLEPVNIRHDVALLLSAGYPQPVHLELKAVRGELIGIELV
jgi:hypothetical protein